MRGHSCAVSTPAAPHGQAGQTGQANYSAAKLGIVGPTRMDYPGTMGSVRAVARYVGRILTEQQ